MTSDDNGKWCHRRFWNPPQKSYIFFKYALRLKTFVALCYDITSHCKVTNFVILTPTKWKKYVKLTVLRRRN